MVGLDWTAAAGWESILADLLAFIADGGLEQATCECYEVVKKE